MSKNVLGPMTMYPKFAYERGPALSPTDVLVRWLDAQVKADGSKRLVRFPVTVEREIDSRKAWIGAAGGPEIGLDDTALGISLADHARRHRNKAKQARLLVEGYWHRKGDAYELSLRRVHGESTPGADFAEVVVDDTIKGEPPSPMPRDSD
ncbi:MAG: hypothetical protein JJE39_14070 [Vicinamibacteria bacterium]|nr:hypothetical protein [Vicinamibacteria bacterium]